MLPIVQFVSLHSAIAFSKHSCHFHQPKSLQSDGNSILSQFFLQVCSHLSAALRHSLSFSPHVFRPEGSREAVGLFET